MNMKKILSRAKDALRLSAVRCCFSFRKNKRTGELWEIVNIRGKKYCAVEIGWVSEPDGDSYTIRYKDIDSIKPEKIELK